MKPDTGSDVVDAILHAAHRVRTGADARLRERGLSLPSYKLLKALAQADLSMREASQALHLSPRTVTDMIDSLEARGLVTRTPHPTDRRVTLLHLTPPGARQLADAAVGADQARAAAISALSADDRRTLRTLLDKVGAPPA
ncbi:MAG: MarR family winged helix-turn-helix transcriptional regulator [Streptosporangiaceae bacterium]